MRIALLPIAVAFCCSSTTLNAATLIHAGKLINVESGKVLTEQTIVIEGEIITNGTHEILLKESEIYKNFYEKQLRKV